MLNLKGKSSFTVRFTIAVLALVASVVVSLMLVFFVNLRSIIHRQTETIASERVANLQKSILNMFKENEKILYSTAHGISTIFEKGNVSRQEMANYFSPIVESASEIQLLYFAGNNLWHEPNGFVASFPDWTPPQGWDHTVRPWFIGAKKSPGQIAYSEPYVDAASGDIIIAMSTEVFDKNKNSIGVLVADIVSVAKLDTLLNTDVIIAEQEIYLLNKDGFFVTNRDSKAIMKKNFFDESTFAQYKDEVLSSAVFSKMNGNAFFCSARIPAAGWTIVSTIPASVIYAEINSLMLRLVILSLVILASIAVISILFTYKLMENQHKKEMLEEKKFARDLISVSRTHYQEMKELQDMLRTLHHNFKYHLKVIDELLRANHVNEIKQYLADFRGKMPEGDFNYYCSNQTINALLSNYAKRCKELNVQYKVRFELPETFSIPDYDVCIVLGNLLENALEASKKIETGREIELAIKLNYSQLLIMIKNSFNGIVDKKGEKIVSSKKDGGLGLPGVHAIVESCDGHVKTEWDESKFTVYVMLNVEQKGIN